MTEENMNSKSEVSDAPSNPESSTANVDSGFQKTSWFDPAKGNLLQFLGIVIVTMGIPFLFFASTRPIGFLLCPIGTALYVVGRFANWYFWYRLQ